VSGGDNSHIASPFSTQAGPMKNKATHLFNVFAKWTSRFAGHPATFVGAFLVIILWALSGPVFHFSDTWQLVINTGTTIVTFLMVFLIQNTQNRDTGAIQSKLDELIRATTGAHNALLDLEEMEDEDIENIRKNYRELAAESREEIRRGGNDTECADVNHETPAREDEPKLK
jgi:low affinity Fe/Cu permease